MLSFCELSLLHLKPPFQIFVLPATMTHFSYVTLINFGLQLYYKLALNVNLCRSLPRP